MYHKTMDSATYSPNDFPVNTHGGLLAFGAPWETPAMFNVIEAVDQLSDRAGERQLTKPRRALCYGNGGIFSHSAVAILGRGRG
jgi:acetyl-CoA acetyltransferase